MFSLDKLLKVLHAVNKILLFLIIVYLFKSGFDTFYDYYQVQRSHHIGNGDFLIVCVISPLCEKLWWLCGITDYYLTYFIEIFFPLDRKTHFVIQLYFLYYYLKTIPLIMYGLLCFYLFLLFSDPHDRFEIENFDIKLPGENLYNFIFN